MMLDGPHVIESELVGQLHLLQGLEIDAPLGFVIPRPRDGKLVKDAKLHWVLTLLFALLVRTVEKPHAAGLCHQAGAPFSPSPGWESDCWKSRGWWYAGGARLCQEKSPGRRRAEPPARDGGAWAI